jgi:hypothetical protein
LLHAYRSHGALQHRHDLFKRLTQPTHGVHHPDQRLRNSAELVAPVNYIIFRSDHPDRVQFVMLDGSVHFVTSGSDRRVRNTLVTRAGEEVGATLE